MSNVLELRVTTLEDKTSKMEGAANKLARLTKDLQGGQLTIVEVLEELTGDISKDVREQVSQEIEAKSAEIAQELKVELSNVKSELEYMKNIFNNEMPSPRASYELLKKLRSAVVRNILKGNKSPQYILISKRIFGYMTAMLNDHFEVSSYKDLPYSKLEEAKTIISSCYPNRKWISELWEDLLGEYEKGELSVKRSNAVKEILKSKQTLMSLVN